MGAKKSTVCTSARSSATTKTPASSKVSRPTSSRRSVSRGSPARASDRSPGPIFDAQPAQRANWVSRKMSSRVCVMRSKVKGKRQKGAGNPSCLSPSVYRLRLAHRDDGVDLDQDAARQAGDLHGGARRACISDRVRVDLVHARKVGHVHEV